MSTTPVTPAQHSGRLQNPSLTAVMRSMVNIPASGELSTPPSTRENTPKRTPADIEREIALLNNSENIFGFRRPLRRKSSNSSLRSVNSISSISSISSITSLSGGISSIKNKIKDKMRRKRKMCDEDHLGVITKRKRQGSIGNIMSANTSCTTPNRTKSATISRTPSLRMIRSPSNDFVKPYSGPAHTPSRVRQSEIWQTTIDPFVLEHMPPALVRRQEAVHELLQGEKELVEDLNLVIKVFYGPMKQLGLVTDAQMQQIFGNIQELIAAHQDIVDKLQRLQNQIGVYDNITSVVTQWIPTLHCYAKYCSNQIYAKEVLDAISLKPDVADFLERCRASSFSRKLDLWSFLDTPRRRLPKYILLIKNIMKMTLPSHPDKTGLTTAIELLHVVLSDVDRATGQAKCEKYKSRLLFLHDKHNTTEIRTASVLLCDGPLKNKNGTKLHGLIFDTVFVLTRQLHKDNVLYQVYRQPIPVSRIQVEDLQEVRVGGSFKRTFTSGEVSKNFFRVWEGESSGYQLLVQHGTKKQWIDSITNARKTLEKRRPAALQIQPAVPRPLGPRSTEDDDDLTPTTPRLPTTPRPTTPVPPTTQGYNTPAGTVRDGNHGNSNQGHKTPGAPSASLNTGYVSPPVEFITPQPKRPVSRTLANSDVTTAPPDDDVTDGAVHIDGDLVIYTPTSTGKAVTSQSRDLSRDKSLPATLLQENLENEPSVGNTGNHGNTGTHGKSGDHGKSLMTPLRTRSPALLLRTDENVKRLVPDESDLSPARPRLNIAKSSLV